MGFRLIDAIYKGIIGALLVCCFNAAMSVALMFALIGTGIKTTWMAVSLGAAIFFLYLVIASAAYIARKLKRQIAEIFSNMREGGQ